MISDIPVISPLNLLKTEIFIYVFPSSFKYYFSVSFWTLLKIIWLHCFNIFLSKYFHFPKMQYVKMSISNQRCPYPSLIFVFSRIFRTYSTFCFTYSALYIVASFSLPASKSYFYFKLKNFNFLKNLTQLHYFFNRKGSDEEWESATRNIERVRFHRQV